MNRRILMYSLLAAAVVVAAVLVFVAFGREATLNASPAATPSASLHALGQTATPTPTPTPVAPVTVSVLSDSHAYFAESWWRQTVVAGALPNVVMGAFESHPGYVSTQLNDYLDAAAAPAGFVIVQVGTNDLLQGVSVAETAASIQALWQGVRDRGASPIAALVPPSTTVPEAVVELNAAIAAAAAASGVPVLDVYTPVAQPDGTWIPGYSDDGVHANGAGSAPQAQAVMGQLPALLGLARAG